MNTPSVKFRRAKETSFLILDEIIFDLFSPFALKVYGQLRKLVSYNKECDEAEITVKNLANLSGISERKTYEVLNELEHEHFIIQRTNIYHFRYGQINSFTVSQTYNFFKPVQEETTTAPNAGVVDNSVQNLTTPAPYAVPTAQYAEGTAPCADIYKEQESLQEVSKKKQKTQTVFSDTDSIKNHINLVIANRKDFVEDEVIDQVVFYVGELRSYNAVVKKINIALKLIREGKWNIPNGFNGLTYDSIKQKEEAYEASKKARFEEEAQAFRAITKTAAQGYGMKSLKDVLNHLKGISGGKEADEGAMQKEAV